MPNRDFVTQGEPPKLLEVEFVWSDMRAEPPPAEEQGPHDREYQQPPRYLLLKYDTLGIRG